MKVYEKLAWLFLATVMPSTLLSAQEKRPVDLQKSCSSFVQGFYDWYVPEALRQGSVRAQGLALKLKGSWFDAELSRQLREDAEAQAKVKGEIVGLDFDPFLNSQNPDDRYAVAQIELKNGRYWAEVYAVRSGRKSEKRSIIPELEHRGNQWIFVNFHYGDSERPDRENLLAVLKNFRELRRKSSN